MPKLQRWLVATKMVEVLDKDTLKAIIGLGGQIGGGWCEVHQHICVNQDNKEEIERILTEKGFTVTVPTDERVYHPDYHRAHDAAAHRS